MEPFVIPWRVTTICPDTSRCVSTEQVSYNISVGPRIRANVVYILFQSSLMGPSLDIPIRDGRLALGTWQGIYLNEHRDQGGWGGGHNRRIILTLQGQG
jgi:hypothetical protein